MANVPGSHAKPGSARILLVDDDEGNREVMAYFLRRHGYAVSTATSGEGAIAMIDAEPFALVLLDVVMPGMGGLEALRVLRSRFPSVRLPIIMVTGLDAVDDLTAAVDLGADDYVTKPYQLAATLTRIQAVLGRVAADSARLT